MAIEVWEADSFSLIVSWKLPNGSVKTLNGASVEAFAVQTSTGAKIELPSTILDASGGKTRSAVPAFTFSSSTYNVQVIVTMNGVTRTFEDSITVRKSFKVSA